MHIDINQHIGDRLSTRRLDLGLTLKDLERATGIGFRQIQKYEAGKNRISAAYLFRFAKALEVSTEYFYQGWTDPSISIAVKDWSPKNRGGRPKKGP